MKKINHLLSLIFAAVLLVACSEENVIIEEETAFSELSVELLSGLAETFPEEDLTLLVGKGSDGVECACVRPYRRE